MIKFIIGMYLLSLIPKILQRISSEAEVGGVDSNEDRS